MNNEQFIQAYQEIRNGTDYFYVNPLYKNFLYSGGVKECAEAGCYWLLDILGTELTEESFTEKQSYLCIVKVTSNPDRSLNIVGEFYDGDPLPYTKYLSFSDLPQGTWTFYVSDDGDGKIRCILPTEY